MIETGRMEMEQFSRTERLLGARAMAALAQARVAVFGIGGVGGHVCEALARSGVGALDLVDDDQVALSNLNRQIIATHQTLGRDKVEVMRERILDINPRAVVRARKCFFLPENADDFPFGEYDYVVDAVDTVAAKLALIMKARECGVPVISAMGAGNKLDPTRFRVSDVYETTVCPLARIMRRECRKRGIEHLKVVWSDEPPLTPIEAAEGVAAPADIHPRRAVPGSTAFVPAVAGLIIAGEVVRDLTKDYVREE